MGFHRLQLRGQPGRRTDRRSSGQEVRAPAGARLDRPPSRKAFPALPGRPHRHRRHGEPGTRQRDPGHPQPRLRRGAALSLGAVRRSRRRHPSQAAQPQIPGEGDSRPWRGHAQDFRFSLPSGGCALHGRQRQAGTHPPACQSGGPVRPLCHDPDTA